MKKTLGVILCASMVAAAVPAFAGEAAADGKALFGKKCAMCHGADGVAKAMAKGSKNFNDPAFEASADQIAKDILEGKGKMKKIAMTPEEAKAVADYAKTLAPKK